jgi:hypothetical protein
MNPRGKAMTEAQAIQVVTQYLANLEQPHNGFSEARLLHADRLNAIAGYERFEGDFWVVDFWKLLPPNVLFESPAVISVVVITTTQRVYILPTP